MYQYTTYNTTLHTLTNGCVPRAYTCTYMKPTPHGDSVPPLTSPKRSPTHLATMMESMMGRPYVVSWVASITITVMLIVIRTTPPVWGRPRWEVGPVRRKRGEDRRDERGGERGGGEMQSQSLRTHQTKPSFSQRGPRIGLKPWNYVSDIDTQFT